MSRAEGSPATAIDAAILAAQKAVPGRVPPLDPFVQTPPEMRLLAEASGALWTDGLPTVTHIETVEIAGPGGPLRARWVAPGCREAVPQVPWGRLAYRECRHA